MTKKTEKDADERRLRRNADQRRRYAQLLQEKKEAALQKNRARASLKTKQTSIRFNEIPCIIKENNEANNTGSSSSAVNKASHSTRPNAPLREDFIPIARSTKHTTTLSRTEDFAKTSMQTDDAYKDIYRPSSLKKKPRSKLNKGCS